MTDPDPGQQRPHRHCEAERPNLLVAIANLRATGQPWRQVLRQVAANFWLKASSRRNCCGNFGQPGC